MDNIRLIDANALRKKAVPHTRGERAYCADIKKWAVLVSDLDDAPTIDAVPVVHGRWEFHYMGANKDKVFAECTECGAVFTLNAFDFGLCYDYCPSCGAKMDLEVD